MIKKIFFPNFKFELIRNLSSENENKTILHVDSNLTKREIINYIEKIYLVKVKNLKTINMRGKRKLVKGRYIHKRPDYKKVVVTFK